MNYFSCLSHDNSRNKRIEVSVTAVGIWTRKSVPYWSNARLKERKEKPIEYNALIIRFQVAAIHNVRGAVTYYA